MITLWPMLRSWLDRLHPRRKRALAKRGLENICRQAGCSRALARHIATAYFK